MFAMRHVFSVLILSLMYERSKSQRNFNNWLFDYIKDLEDGKFLKIHGVVYLLLKFSDLKDFESVETCLIVFNEQIKIDDRLKKFKKTALKKLEAHKKSDSD